MSGPFVATFAFVLLAEIAGDKLLYTTGILATRYRAEPIAVGITAAFMAKMAAAVVLGAAIGQLSPFIVAAVSALGFVGVGWAVWRAPEMSRFRFREETPSHRAALIAFATICFSEWGDVGQIAAATMAVRYRSPFLVWAGAVSAMAVKGAVAAAIGGYTRNLLRERMQAERTRLLATGAVIVVATISVVEILRR